MKRPTVLVSAALGLCLLLSACSAAATETDGGDADITGAGEALVGNLPVSFPLTDSPRSLNILITGAGNLDQEDVFVWQEYEKMTGVNINWTTVTKEERSEAVHSALTNSQKLDLIMRCKISATRLTKYGSSGLILDLAKDGLLEKNAPNCWAYLQSHPDTLASVMNPDGSIYSLPQVNSGAELRVAMKMYVNKQWLERVGMDLPATTEELRQLLLAFKEQDANGNGDRDDELPLSCDYGSVKNSLYGSFGLENRGFHNESVDCDPDTGNVRFIEGCPQYKSYLEYMHSLYADGLLDKSTFTMSTDQIAGNIAADRVGVFCSTNLALLPADKVGDYVAVEQALTGPDGDKLWSAVRANFHSTGAAVIPASCGDPALVLRWLDYFWTDEGTLFYHMGVEGSTYQVRGDGAYDYVPAIYEEMAAKNLPFDSVVSEYSPYPGGSNPTVEIAPYFMGGEMADVPAQAARALIEYGPEQCWPSFTFTEEENAELDALRGDIEKYCDNMRVDFITGARPLDQFDAYTQQLEKLGVDRLLVIYQAAADRYHSLITALN